MKVIKSIPVGGFNHQLVDHGYGYQVRIYNGDELYHTGQNKNTLEKGLDDLESSVSYTEKQTRQKRHSER